MAREARVTVVFRRPAGKASALASTVTVPAPYSIVSHPAEIGATEALRFEAKDLNGPVAVVVSGGCLKRTNTLASPKGGRFETPPLNLTFATNVSRCDASFEVRATTAGRMDPAFGSSNDIFDRTGYESVQRRTFHAVVKP